MTILLWPKSRIDKRFACQQAGGEYYNMQR